MGYLELHAFCQTLSPKVGRNQIKAKVLELVGVEHVKVLKAGLDTSVCRGFYLAPTNTSHHFVQMHGKHVIVLARGLHPTLERFVFVKELMHVFDSVEESTSSPEQFEAVLGELTFSSSGVKSAQFRSELDAMLMALAVLCPLPFREEFARRLSGGQGKEEDLAKALDIPPAWATIIMRDAYLGQLQNLLDRLRQQA